MRTLEAAVAAFSEAGIRVVRRSSWYRSAPEPPSAQPWFFNGVIAIDTQRGPTSLLGALMEIERRFGRRRVKANAARTLDLDLIDFRGIVASGRPPPILPHPRAHERAFVLVPLAEILPDWQHPLSGCSVTRLISRIPKIRKNLRMV